LHDNLVLIYVKLFCVDGNVGCTVLPVRIFHSKKLLFISVSLNLLTLVLSFIRQLIVLLTCTAMQSLDNQESHCHHSWGSAIFVYRQFPVWITKELCTQDYALHPSAVSSYVSWH